jgi:D-alanyl-lipoteichoic acid acyltransferase DltB (MBOAT superfamily)
MLFNSVEFLVFFVLVYGLYLTFQGRYRVQNLLLLAGSYFFYGWWDIRFLFLIVITTVVDYNTALIIREGTSTIRQRGLSSLYLMAASLLFLTFQWGALDFSPMWIGDAPKLDFLGLLPRTSSGWAGFLLTTAALVGANLVYFVMIRLERDVRAKVALALSIIVNLGILGFFKYYNFFADSFAVLSENALGYTPDRFTLEIVLPVGISFYTFQSMSYTIDTFRRDVEPTTSLIDFAAYLSFFPQLVAGPIERGKNLLPQFRRPRTLDWEQSRRGIWLVAWGLYKKVVIADNVAAIVNGTFGPYDGANPSGLVPDDGLRILVAVLAFAVQIYADFSGYSDIARGTAKLMGFDIMVNFRLPYIAKDPSDFWQRWHISLSTWLRDYLYIPLGGNRGGPWGTYRNLMITMILGGLWHGAAWNFVIWGFYQGLILVLYRYFDERGWRLPDFAGKDWLKGVVMFCFVLYGWLIFRAQNLETIGVFTEAIFLHPRGSAEAVADFRTLLFYAHPLIIFQALQVYFGTMNPMIKWPVLIRVAVWTFMIMSILALAPSEGGEFIYFAF